MPSELPPAVLGERYMQTLKIVGATAPDVAWMPIGALPPGLTLTKDEMVITYPSPQAQAQLVGTPTMTGSFPFEVTVSLEGPVTCASPPARRSYEIIVTDPDADAGAGAGAGKR